MSLTDEQIKEVWRSVKDTGRYMHDAITFARAIESAATAPLLEKIAELEKANAAQRVPDGLVELLTKRANDSYSCSLLSKDALAILSAAPQPEQPVAQGEPVAWFDNTGAIKGRVSDEQLEALCREALAELGRRNGWEQQNASTIGNEWTPCMKKPVVVHVRQQRHGESHISTREGLAPVKDDDLVMRGIEGEEYPIGREIFNRTYTLDVEQPVETDMPPLPEPRELGEYYNGTPITGFDEDQMWEYAKDARAFQPAAQGEPVAWGARLPLTGEIFECITPSEHDENPGVYTIALYTHPLPTSKPMTRDDMRKLLKEHFDNDVLTGDDFNLIRAVERFHHIKEN